MLDFHDPLVVASLFLDLVFFEHSFRFGILLAVVVSVRDAYIEKGVLASSPESSGTNVEAGVVVDVGGRAVIVFVMNFLDGKLCMILLL